ncbi:D-alanine--D-alanine ligase [Candidatus Hepatincola sp. Pdp]
MRNKIFYNYDSLNVNIEKESLHKFKQELTNKFIILVEGNHSEENKFYKNNAPSEILGIQSINEVLHNLELKFLRIKSTDPKLKEYLNYCDYVFIYAQGEFGEDGRLQGWLDYIGKDYPGSGVSASAICCDKLYFKHIMKASGIKTPDYQILFKSDDYFSFKSKADNIGYPLMIKERTGGSSLGITLIVTETELKIWFENKTRKSTDQYLMEKFLDGNFATVGIINLSDGYYILPILSVETDSRFYDADLKLSKSNNIIKYKINSLPAHIIEKLKHTAWDAFCMSGCEGLGRIDFIIYDNEVYVLEINTVPGISYDGNFTQMFTSLGFTYEELVLAVIHTAFLKASNNIKETVYG